MLVVVLESHYGSIQNETQEVFLAHAEAFAWKFYMEMLVGSLKLLH